jgi:GT2 family glycosyltransferase
MTTSLAPLTVAIPTYRRERVLIDTVEFVLALKPKPAEVLVLDQTERHEPEIERQLQALARQGAIRWERLRIPSIPKAMNQGLLLATQGIILFLDDDIRPDPGLVRAHLQAHARGETLVAGRVIQPWHEGVSFPDEEPFHFASVHPRWVKEFMGGNFSVRREAALALGGFDENFVRVAYRFEAEFANRLVSNGARIFFEPAACIHHLKVGVGGTRAYGNQFTTWLPDHAVGAYYHAIRSGAVGEFLRRPFSAVATRYHLRHPWHIPGSLLAELTGLLWALWLCWRGPKYIDFASERRKTND